MKYRIVSDSSSNIFETRDVEYTAVPMKIITDQKEYVDLPGMDVEGMVSDLKKYSGKSSSSCPNTQEWIEAFGDADAVFAITITSSLSGSYSSAVSAAEEYMKNHEGARVCVIDSLSAGPELQLVIEKLRERILAGDSFDEIESTARKYLEHTHLIFALQLLNNLARNGRVNPAVAKIAGVLGICVVGKASDHGTLEQMHKCRGEQKELKVIVSDMKEMGFGGGKVRIAHCMNAPAAEQLKKMLLSEFKSSDIQIDVCKGLCSFYAEKGGLMIGFEDAL